MLIQFEIRLANTLGQPSLDGISDICWTVAQKDPDMPVEALVHEISPIQASDARATKDYPPRELVA
ncbi:hypothetical protein AWM79_23365 [Pseudomonas agarici]|uniref:Uncharacterized protein n=1 Tax=Pseudomonas agarici TaxID=46677 RepID=A0A0X1T7H2_PSEAA|nr:hypothetical protein [Pseudomonas agarici]AMB88055.1 hypothetical protein AWM79_23365 [Pseudomonas agarici]NWB92938.1 hypothetical protein [Pseudomonas agarici]NWC09205.1 hypothetical protein [Pseudomonas agarici]